MPYMNKGGQTYQNQVRARGLGMDPGNIPNVQSELAHNSKPSIENSNVIPGSGSSGRLFNAKYKQENPFQNDPKRMPVAYQGNTTHIRTVGQEGITSHQAPQL